VNVLVWQWGRRGGDPCIAIELAEAMSQLSGVHGLLSLSNRAEILAAPNGSELPAIRHLATDS
jgi:hypothetical protein